MVKTTPIEIMIGDLPEVQATFEEQAARFERLQSSAAAAYVAWATKAKDLPNAMLDLKEAIRS